MRRPGLGLRVLMAVVGVVVLLFYLLAAWGGVLLLELVWAIRPDLPTMVALVVATTLGFGYLPEPPARPIAVSRDVGPGWLPGSHRRHVRRSKD